MRGLLGALLGVAGVPLILSWLVKRERDVYLCTNQLPPLGLMLIISADGGILPGVFATIAASSKKNF